MGSQITQAKISVGRAGIARPLALPMGELARLKAVTERVPCSNLRTPCKFATAYALSGSLFARQLPQRGSQGRLRRRIPANFTPATGRAQPAPWLSLWESWHGVAVTERVPSSNQRTNLQTCHCPRPLRLAVGSPAPPKGEPRAAAPPNSLQMFDGAIVGAVRPIVHPAG